MNVNVIDNALPSDLFQKYKELVLSEDVEYLFSKVNNNDSNFAFSHVCRDSCKQRHELFNEVADQIKKYLPNNVGGLLRVRHAITTKAGKDRTHAKHIDKPFDHYVGLIYLQDSDGDTILYKGNSNNELQRIMPKENRLVCFKGSIYHSSKPPLNYDYRVIGNYNFNV